LLKEEKEKIDKEYEKLFDNEKIEEWYLYLFSLEHILLALYNNIENCYYMIILIKLN
jgi:hypothetical protein